MSTPLGHDRPEGRLVCVERVGDLWGRLRRVETRTNSSHPSPTAGVTQSSTHRLASWRRYETRPAMPARVWRRMAFCVPANLLGPRVTFALPRGASLAYRASLGSSRDPPLMLLHGLGMTADLNWGATYPELCRRFRVVAPDLPGHGRGVARGRNSASRSARTTSWRWPIR